jgi:hypothetical protein
LKNLRRKLWGGGGDADDDDLNLHWGEEGCRGRESRYGIEQQSLRFYTISSPMRNSAALADLGETFSSGLSGLLAEESFAIAAPI